MIESAEIRQAARALRAGKLVIVPTETVYGVAADPRAPAAVEAIYRAKQREAGKPIPLLAADLAAVRHAGAELGPVEERLAQRFWPGPLTLVLRVGSGTEGFRVPRHDVARALLREMGGLLRVTSANRSGRPPAVTAAEAARMLGAAVAAVLDDGPAAGGQPSTVVRAHGGSIEILREGAIPEAEVRRTARDDA
jgi:L-threonylcarbamoyladenylate synthase